jgi:2-polyprenyl-3-methyl-5-hydroxy-6-metoxy-1,4-benzoquinol methylase
MFAGHYTEWVKFRMNGIKKYINADYFKSKSLLELGCGYAHIGNKFYELGSIVKSTDARKEHIDVVNKLYPHIKTAIFDADNDKIIDNYDIIVHFGLLYHLSNIEEHLANVAQKCNILLLETETCDSDNKNFYLKTNESGYDQAYNSVAIHGSESYIENILSKNGFQFKIIKDSILNAPLHSYDWEIKNTNTFSHGKRRFWICWKNVDSPLILEK